MLNQFICTYCGELQNSQNVSGYMKYIIVKECIRCGEPRMMDKEARDADRKLMTEYFKNTTDENIIRKLIGLPPND